MLELVLALIYSVAVRFSSPFAALSPQQHPLGPLPTLKAKAVFAEGKSLHSIENKRLTSITPKNIGGGTPKAQFSVDCPIWGILGLASRGDKLSAVCRDQEMPRSFKICEAVRFLAPVSCRVRRYAASIPWLYKLESSLALK